MRKDLQRMRLDSMVWGGTEVELPAEELMATDDCGGKVNHFSSRIKVLRGYPCSSRLVHIQKDPS